MSNSIRREQRQARGLSPSPLAILLSARLSVPSTLPLLQDADSHILIVTASNDTPSGCQARVDYLRIDSASAPACDPY